MLVLDHVLKSGRLLGKNAPESVSREILDASIGAETLEKVNFRLWDGSFWPRSGSFAATVMLNRPSALREMFLGESESSIGEAYLNGAFDVKGEMEAAFELADHLMQTTDGWTKKLRIGRHLRQLPKAPLTGGTKQQTRLNGARHSLQRDQQAISFHYNVSNDFYALWLDEQMAYSCAYFRRATDDLATAQINKFEHICRKLALRAGDRFLDIGCGWGGLICHAARNYGVQAEGITLSQEQLNFAQDKTRREGLSNRVSIRLLDYRELPPDGAYDAIASVGMV